MAKKVNKSIHYFRAVSDNQFLNLEEHIRYLLAVVSYPMVEKYGQITQVLHRKLQPEYQNILLPGLLLHIGNSTKDEYMNTMKNQSLVSDDDGSPQAPPLGSSFLSREAFIYVNSHHVVFCGNGLRVPSISTYLKSVNSQLRKENADDIPLLEFDLQPVANGNKLKLIQNHGVQYLSLGATASNITISQISSSNVPWYIHVLKRIAQLGHKEPTLEEQEAKAEIQTGIWLKLQGNKKASIEAKNLMREQAEKIVTDDELDTGFFIKTMNGDIIEPNDVRLSRKVYLPKFLDTNTLSVLDTFDALLNYFFELENNHLTEQ